MNDTPCYARPEDPIPDALWIPSGSYRIYRGTASEMVQQMAAATAPGEISTRQALRLLTRLLSRTKGLLIDLPWNQPDETLAHLFIHGLLVSRISQQVPKA